MSNKLEIADDHQTDVDQGDHPTLFIHSPAHLPDSEWATIPHDQPDSAILLPSPAWRCEIIPGMYRDVSKGDEPNWFHRLMQWLFFGWKWHRVKP